MKAAAKQSMKPRETFEEEYRAALYKYAAHGGEAALGRAYELGRRAIAEKKSLMEIASLHHQALHGMLSDAGEPARGKEVLAAAADFLAEILSPFEMAQRGVQDAVAALRQFNETLEEEIKRIAYGVHDDAGQILVAVHLALADVARELPERQKEQVGRIEELLQQVEGQLRRYSHELRPTVLDDLGWIPAIRFLAEGVSKRAHLVIRVKTTIAGRLPGAVETALYRIVQEVLTNAAKHAKATSGWIPTITVSAPRSRIMCAISRSVRDANESITSIAVTSTITARERNLTTCCTSPMRSRLRSASERAA